MHLTDLSDDQLKSERIGPTIRQREAVMADTKQCSDCRGFGWTLRLLNAIDYGQEDCHRCKGTGQTPPRGKLYPKGTYYDMQVERRRLDEEMRLTSWGDYME